MAEYPAAIFTAMTRGALMSDTTTQGAFVDKLQDELRAALSTLGINPQGVLATVAAAVAPTAWTAVSFLNSWANFGGYQGLTYRKVGDMVQVRGTISHPSGGSGTVVANLPSGFRPPANIEMVVKAGGGTGYLTIAGTGDMTYTNSTDGSALVSVSVLGGFSITA